MLTRAHKIYREHGKKSEAGAFKLQIFSVHFLVQKKFQLGLGAKKDVRLRAKKLKASVLSSNFAQRAILRWVHATASILS